VCYCTQKSLLNFNVPNRRTRQLNNFYVPLQRSNNGKYAPKNKLMQLVNYLNFDLFSCVSIIDDFNYYLNRFWLDNQYNILCQCHTFMSSFHCYIYFNHFLLVNYFHYKRSQHHIYKHLNN